MLHIKNSFSKEMLLMQITLHDKNKKWLKSENSVILLKVTSEELTKFKTLSYADKVIYLKEKYVIIIKPDEIAYFKTLHCITLPEKDTK